MPVETSLCPPFVAYESAYFNNFLYYVASSKRRDELPTTISSRRIRSSRVRCCRQFYRCGSFVGLLTSVASTSLLLFILFQSIITILPTDDSVATSSTSVLTPLVPGVNVPYIHMVYIFIGYAVSTVVHEFGHALAMATVGAHIERMGWFLMCGLPGAYVSCDANTVNALKPHRALRIYFAGVWHNVLLLLCTVATVYAWRWTPIVPSLFYRSGDGVHVVSINSDSTATQLWVQAGVSVGSRIVSVNDLPTSSLEEYENVLVNILKRSEENMKTNNFNQNRTHRNSHRDAIDVRFAASWRTMPWRHGPEALYHDVKVVDARPGILLVGVCDAVMPVACFKIPQIVLLVVSYIASISAGLAFINSLPVFWLDGDDALGAWLQLLLPSRSSNVLLRIKNIILTLGTSLLFGVLFLAFRDAIIAT